MTIDYQALLLDPIYATLGVPAAITLSDNVTTIEGLTVIDKTSGVQLGDKEAKVDSIEPGCCIRAKEWLATGRTLQDLDDATIEFNGSRWTITGRPKRPTPDGARNGEVLLLLKNEEVIESGDSSDMGSSS